MSDLMYAYILRIFWALVLGSFLAFGFRRSWKAEHGGLSEWKAEKGDTVVWFDPIIFPIMLVTIAVIYYWIYGAFDGKHQPNMQYNITTSPKIVFYIPKALMQVLLSVWIAGFVVIFLAQIISHIRFVWNLRKHSYPVDDRDLIEKWNAQKEEMEMYFPIELRYCGMIDTPLTVGMRKNHRITYLPKQIYATEDAELIFSHELHHIQRNDAHTKFFLRFCNALGWIHPLVWAAIRKAEDDLELSCDEIVLKDADSAKRKKYAELLLTTAGNACGFTTCLSASARTLKYRMKATIHGKKKRLGTVILFIVMAASVFCTGKICLSTERNTIGSISESSSQSSHFYENYNLA